MEFFVVYVMHIFNVVKTKPVSNSILMITLKQAFVFFLLIMQLSGVFAQMYNIVGIWWIEKEVDTYPWELKPGEEMEKNDVCCLKLSFSEKKKSVFFVLTIAVKLSRTHF